MTYLILVRHGETDWNKIDRIQGGMDIPLNEEGYRQAMELALSLANTKIDAVYSSGLSRCYETALAIAKCHNLKVKKVPQLNELNQGLWQGLRIEDVKVRYKKQYANWKTNPFSVTPPKGENIEAANKRVVSAVQNIINRHRGGTICIVLHQIVSALVRCHFQGLQINKIWELVPDRATWEMMTVED